MDSTWLNIFSILTVFLFVIVSPGPNFVLVLNTALSDSRRAGVYTALGVATGSGLFALAGLLGLILLFNGVPYFETLLPYLGGGYLIYLGLNMVRNAFRGTAEANLVSVSNSARAWQAYRIGLFTNLTNPKAWAFYLSLFTLVVTPDTPLWAKIFLNLSMFAISFGWYGLVALLISSPRIRPWFARGQRWVEGVLGVVLVGLGGKVLLRS